MNIMAIASKQGSPTLQQQIEKFMEEYKDIFSSPTEVPLHYQVKHSIDMTPGAPLPDVVIPYAIT